MPTNAHVEMVGQLYTSTYVSPYEASMYVPETITSKPKYELPEEAPRYCGGDDDAVQPVVVQAYRYTAPCRALRYSGAATAKTDDVMEREAPQPPKTAHDGVRVVDDKRCCLRTVISNGSGDRGGLSARSRAAVSGRNGVDVRGWRDAARSDVSHDDEVGVHRHEGAKVSHGIGRDEVGDPT